MSDPFELLGLPRRPWLDEAAIRGAFQDRARWCHPDASEGDRNAFAALNTAHALVADPAERLRELAAGAVIPSMPSDIQLGFRTGEFVGKVDALLERAGNSTNVLAKALLASEAEPIRRGLAEIVAELVAWRAELEARLRLLDGRWPEGESSALAALCADFTFLARWQEQVRERVLLSEIAFGKTGGRGRPPSD